MQMALTATITCPKCGHQAVETMPTMACLLLLRVQRLQDRAEADAGRLLRVLLVLRSAVSTKAVGRGALIGSGTTATVSALSGPVDWCFICSEWSQHRYDRVD